MSRYTKYTIGKIPIYIYKKDVLYFYIRNQSGAKIKKKRVSILSYIYRKYPYIIEYRHNLGKIQERKGVHIVYISKYLWAKTKNKNSVYAIYIVKYIFLYIGKYIYGVHILWEKYKIKNSVLAIYIYIETPLNSGQNI